MHFATVFILFVAIENEYKGPELEDGKVTLKFMKELMELYKKEGKLHRKYAYKVCIFYCLFFKYTSLM